MQAGGRVSLIPLYGVQSMPIGTHFLSCSFFIPFLCQRLDAKALTKFPAGEAHLSGDVSAWLRSLPAGLPGIVSGCWNAASVQHR